jgi:hypothetical protein
VRWATIPLALLTGIGFALGGGLVAFVANLLLVDYKSSWLDKLGLDGPPGGVFFVLSIVLLGAIAGIGGFAFVLSRLRRKHNL